METERSVGLTHGDLFSGIGGFALAARWMGWDTRYFAEINPYCRDVLAHHWPGVPILGDVSQVKWGPQHHVDVLTAGFPCQPVSLAGRRKGEEDERWLWPEVERAVRVVRPRWIVLENVPGLLHRGMHAVLGGLATLGYAAEWQTVSAAQVGAPHLRNRVWIVGHAERVGLTGQSWRGTGPVVADGHGELEGDGESAGGDRTAMAHADGDGCAGHASADEGESCGLGRDAIGEACVVAYGGGEGVAYADCHGEPQSEGIEKNIGGRAFNGGEARDDADTDRDGREAERADDAGQSQSAVIREGHGADPDEIGRRGRRATQAAEHEAGAAAARVRGAAGDDGDGSVGTVPGRAGARASGKRNAPDSELEGLEGHGITGDVGASGSEASAHVAAACCDGEHGAGFTSHWLLEPPVGRLAHGVPDRVAQLEALGNAIVPQVAFAYPFQVIHREESAARDAREARQAKRRAGKAVKAKSVKASTKPVRGRGSRAVKGRRSRR